MLDGDGERNSSPDSSGIVEIKLTLHQCPDESTSLLLESVERPVFVLEDEAMSPRIAPLSIVGETSAGSGIGSESINKMLIEVSLISGRI